MEFVTLSFSESLLLLPMTALFIFACIPITIKVFNKNIEPSNSMVLGISTVGLVIAAVLVKLQGASASPVFFGALTFDKLASVLNFSILAVTFFTLLMSHSNVNTKAQSFAEHVFLILSSATGMMTLASSNDLMVTFVGLELMSMALYVLIALGHEQKFSKEAAFKYFILGSFASALFLFGISFIFGTTGTTQINLISHDAHNLLLTSNLFIIGVGLILVGLCFKVSIFPFHAWTPDVYQGAPTPVSAFMATGVKLVMFAVLVRLALEHFFMGNYKLVLVMQILAVLTMTAGNISALVQENIKRIVAYSSVAHAGYMFVGVIATSQSASSDAATATLFYVISYAMMNIGAFAVISLLEKVERAGLNINDYAGLGYKRPYLGFAMTVFMLALAGMPPTVGFIGKFYVFSAAVNEGYLWLAIFGVINSLLSAYYYLRVIVVMYMKEPVYAAPKAEGYWPAKAVVFISVILTLVFGLFSLGIYTPAHKSVAKNSDVSEVSQK